MLFLFAILTITMTNERPFLTFVDPADIAAPATITTPSAIQEGLDQTAPMTNVEQAPAPVQPTVRTYHQDMHRIMGQNNPKTMSTILENVRQEEAVKAATTLVTPKNKLLLTASIVCIIAGIAALLFVAYRNYATTATLEQGQTNSLIQAETHTNVTLVLGEQFKNRERIQSALAVNTPLETINNIFMTQQSLTGLVRIGFSDMITATGGTVPATLLATLDTPFMYGTYRSSQALPFLILRVNNYDDAFDGMRAWEPLMLAQLGFLFELPENLPTISTKTVFEDAVINNRTVRIARYVAPQQIIEPIAPEIIETLPVVTPEITDTTPITAETIQTQETETPGIETQSTNEEVAQPAVVTDEAIPVLESEISSPNEPETTVAPYQEGDTILMYTFLNEKTILITTSESVLQEILFRLTNAQLLL